MHWNDVDEIAMSLEENYPDEDISELTLKDLEDLIKSLSDFDDHEIEPNKEVLKEILEAWREMKDGHFEG
ncbi:MULTISPECIES: Fe-S cluster assembly protein IscX [unclassified Candidatus Tisiphia]|uniref:Fe-S cluster assembly protein IscX n=1 Tax=unclassified Candidatus Tisiphia TaxID=2996318 RepID=UPI00312C9214|nr:Fe-S cluster assembly protein IscX [Rickettsia endosymbiont of Platyusa sonomae]MCC8415812.1 Fe-S cluster assembly protein IscX [Rickettsia endosymbiont of Gnoriste bilineata]